jgi:flagellar biosynthesis protein FlhF
MNCERKSYFAATVEAAVAEARMELGEDTLIVEAKHLVGDGNAQGGYEVIFEVPGAGGVTESQAAAEPRIDTLLNEVAGLKQDLAQMTGLLKHLAAAAHGVHSELAPLAAGLADAGFPQEVASGILDRVDRRLGYGQRRDGIGAGEARRALAAEIESRIAVRPGAGMAAAARKVVVLAGPPGTGKTTTLAKLAVTQGVTPGVPAVIISTDAYRVAAADQLRCYAAILGLPFVAADSPGALLRALEEHRNKRLVLIDTPGYGPRDFEMAKEWTRLFTARSEIEVQLVLNATTHFRDLARAVERWAVMEPSRLIFTHMDEASSYGGMLSCAMQAGLPVSFVCSGQSVPEDIEEATSSLLLKLVVGQDQGFRAAAA